MSESKFYREKIDLAKSYFRNKEYYLAKQIFLEVYKKYPDNIYCIGSLSTIYSDYLNNYNEAKKYLVKLIKLLPTNELASTSLFFCYLHLGSYDKAFKELRRFVDTNKYSHKYRIILKDIRLKHIPDHYKGLVKIYRKILNEYFQNNLNKHAYQNFKP